LKDIKYNSVNDAHRVAELVFEDNHGNTVVKPYNYAAVYPDCRIPKALAESSLVDPTSKLVTLDKYTLKHTKFENVYAIGECTDLPTVSNALAQFP
jgi:sulfide:quinone oxidoreductase